MIFQGPPTLKTVLSLQRGSHFQVFGLFQKTSKNNAPGTSKTTRNRPQILSKSCPKTIKKNMSKNIGKSALQAPNMDPKTDPKIDEKSSWTRFGRSWPRDVSAKWSRHPTMTPKWPQNDAKMTPKPFQNQKKSNNNNYRLIQKTMKQSFHCLLPVLLTGAGGSGRSP